MSTFRRWVTAVAALGLGLTAVVGGSGSADAATTGFETAGAHTYTFTQAAESGTASTGTLQWNNTTWALSVTAKTGQLASGSCVTVYFDWRSNGHHDARAVRNCKSNDTFSYAFTDASPSNLVAGVNRMGICYGAEDTLGTCTYYLISSRAIAQPPMDWTPWPQPTWANPCVLSWARRSSTGEGSVFLDAHAQRRAPNGATC